MYQSFQIRLSLKIGVIIFALVSHVMADWPQFQGPNRDGHAVNQDLARSWPENGPKEVWSIPLGEGFAGPAIVDGEVYILDRIDNKQDVLRCIDLESGKEIWKYTNDTPGETEMNGSRATPTVDEKYVYAVGLLGDMYCVDRKSHKVVWKKNLLDDLGGSKSVWGVAQNPVLYENLVIVAPQGPKVSVVALEKETGNEVWRSEGLGGPAYSSPAVVTLGGIKHVVMIAPPEEDESDDEAEDDENEERDVNKGEDEDIEAEDSGKEPPGMVAGISLENGEILWTYRGWSCGIPIPFPVQLSDNRLLVTGGYGAGSVMLKVTHNGNKFEVKELFKLDQKDFGLQIHQPIFYKGYLYANNNGNEHREGMVCMTLDGKLLWRTSDNRKLPRFERGNLLIADGLIVNLDGQKGTLHLIDPSSDGYKELAQANILSGKMMWAPMAISEGKLLVRSQTEMKCIDLRNP